jgi:Fur family ferric uptake transcriptional regulator
VSNAADTRWSDHALAALSGAGYRQGGARTAVVELLGRQSCGLSAREIDAQLDAEGRAIGRASVYRTLDALVELKLVQRLELGSGHARYEPTHPSGDHHHHLVCDRCGRITPFEDPELERALERLAGRVDYDVDEHDVVLHGACGRCRG